MQALRTNLVDSGVGLEVMKIMMQGLVMNKDGRLVKVAREEQVEKDRRVLGAALTVICNCVNDFSPLRTVGPLHFSCRTTLMGSVQEFLNRGLLMRLVQLVEADDDLRRDALWAIKNLLTKMPLDEKKKIMDVLSWSRLVEYVHHLGTTVLSNLL